MNIPFPPYHLGLGELLGVIGALFSVATIWMQTMIPLRLAGIASNAFFLGYGLLAPAYPTFVLYLVLLPVNCFRLYQMTELVREAREASEGNDLSMKWLRAFMTKRQYRKGDILFSKGETAEEMFYVLSGSYLVNEINVNIGPGGLIGELAFLTPENRRTMSVECTEDGDMLTIPYDKVRELYLQNPTFGFYFLRVAAERLLQNIARLESKAKLDIAVAQQTT